MDPASCNGIYAAVMPLALAIDVLLEDEVHRRPALTGRRRAGRGIAGHLPPARIYVFAEPDRAALAEEADPEFTGVRAAWDELTRDMRSFRGYGRFSGMGPGEARAATDEITETE